MTNKLCRADCIYAIDGRCRLEHRGGNHGTAACALYEGYLKQGSLIKEWTGL